LRAGAKQNPPFYLTYSSTLKMEANVPPKRQRATRRYITGCGHLCNHRCENLNSSISLCISFRSFVSISLQFSTLSLSLTQVSFMQISLSPLRVGFPSLSSRFVFHLFANPCICAGHLILCCLMNYEPFPTPCAGMKQPSADCNSSLVLFVTDEAIKTTHKVRHSLFGF
jgi:hypothetical protein